MGKRKKKPPDLEILDEYLKREKIKPPDLEILDEYLKREKIKPPKRRKRDVKA